MCCCSCDVPWYCWLCFMTPFLLFFVIFMGTYPLGTSLRDISTHRATICNTTLSIARFPCTSLTWCSCDGAGLESCSSMQNRSATGTCCLVEACYVRDCSGDGPCSDRYMSSTQTCTAQAGTCANINATISYFKPDQTLVTVNTTWFCSLDDFSCGNRSGASNTSWTCYYDITNPSSVPLNKMPTISSFGLGWLLGAGVPLLIFRIVLSVCFWRDKGDDVKAYCGDKCYAYQAWQQGRAAAKAEKKRLLQEQVELEAVNAAAKAESESMNPPPNLPAWLTPSSKK